MANKKISELTQAMNSLQINDLIEASIDDGSGNYTSEKLTGQQVSDGVQGIIANSSIYGSAFESNTLTFSANVATPVTTSTLLLSSNCQLSGAGLDTGFEVAVAGTIFITFEASVLNNGSATMDEINFFLDLNGTNVTDSARFITAPPNGHIVPFSANWLINVAALDIVTVKIVVAKINYELFYENAFTGDATPAAKLQIFNIG